MKNYKSSDYGINKFSDSIVYKTVNKTIKISLSDYLTANPDKTEQDFCELKALSDEIYLEQVRKDNASTQRNISLENIGQMQDVTAYTLEENYVENLDKHNITLAYKELLEKGNLTEIQTRRFQMHVFENLSFRQIAKIENVHFTSVQDSINLAKKKLKNFFKKF